MKLSLNWLSQYVDLQGLDIKDIANQLTMKTAEVEEVHHLAPNLDNLFIARVLEVQPLEGAARYARLDVGERGLKDTVCAAPNLRVGMVSIFAAAGAVLSDGRKVSEGLVHGRKSQGMLLAPAELGISQYQDGVLDLPDSCAPGTPLAELAPAEDCIIELDNKSITHRPDLWGHYGFARELAAIYKRPLKELDVWGLDKFNELPAYPLKVDDLELCPGYACLALDNLKPAPAPLELQWRLYSVGLRGINLLVDLTNYVMLEVGQPMHAFDGDYISAIRVAVMGGQGREFTTLDNMPRKMLAGDLMIWNEMEPVGIAGVMGGLHSEVTKETQRLVLEAANFQPMAIRRTAVRLNLRTDASTRFEKDLPKSFTTLAIARFLALCAQAGQPPVLRSRLTTAGAVTDKTASITLSNDYISRYVGEPVSQAQIEETLRALGFGCVQEGGQFQVSVPPHRSRRDISIAQDIVEEVARYYGYDNITPTLPSVAITPYIFNEDLRAEHKIRRLLSQAKNFTEVHSYSWYDDRWLERLGYRPQGEFLTLKNPIAPYKARLRQTLIPNLLEFVQQNYDQHNSLRLFEVGHCYWPQGGSGSKEFARLGALVFQAGAESVMEEVFGQVKGVLQDCALLLNVTPPGFNGMIPDCAGQMTDTHSPNKENALSNLGALSGLQLKALENDQSPWALKGAAQQVLLNGKAIGALGYLSGPILNAFKRNARIAWLEIDLPVLAGKAFPDVNVVMPSLYPNSWLDVSLVWPKERGYGELQNILDSFGGDLIEDRKFITFYEGKGLTSGLRSFTFRYWIGSKSRTLGKDDIENFRSDLFAFLAANNIEVR